MKRTSTAVVLGALLIALVAPLAAPANQQRGRVPTAAREAQAEFTRAVRTGDEVAIAEALRGVWEADTNSGAQASLHLIQRGRPHMSPMAVGALLRWGDAELLSASAAELNAARNRDERRLLVRAIGSTEDIDALERLRPFLRDSDELVQAAAIAAIADLGEPEGLTLFADRYPMRPTEQAQRNDRLALELTMHGAALTLTGRAMHTQDDLRTWMREREDGARGRGATRRSGGVERGFNDLPPDRDGRFTTPSFDGRFMVGDLDRTIRDAGAPGWRELYRGLEDAAKSAKSGAEGVFGKAHLPALELRLADERMVAAAGGGPRGFYGFRRPGQVIIHFDNWERVRASVANLTIHSIEMASLGPIPRWLSEGVAESLTRSAQRSEWVGPKYAGAGLTDDVQRGAFSTVRQWTGDVGSNEDPKLYQLAHLAVDYLRYGGFSDANVRLSMLLGRMSRGESEATALQAVYGLSMRELDAGLREWVSSD